MKCLKLNKKNSGDPIYALMGIELYRELALSEGIENPVYGVLLEGELDIGGGDIRERYIREFGSDRVMQEYANFLQVKCNGEPIILMGFSAGGLVAIEAAKILQEKGVQVKAVVMLDTYKDDSFVRSYRKMVEDAAQWAQDAGLAYALKELGGRFFKKIRSSIKRKAFFPVSQAGEPSTSQLEDQCYESAGQYRLKLAPYHGDVLLVRSSTDFGFGMQSVDDYNWKSSLRGDFKTERLPLTHGEFLHGDGVKFLSRVLGAYLSRTKSTAIES